MTEGKGWPEDTRRRNAYAHLVRASEDIAEARAEMRLFGDRDKCEAAIVRAIAEMAAASSAIAPEREADPQTRGPATGAAIRRTARAQRPRKNA